MSAQPIEPANVAGQLELPATEARNRLARLIDAVADGGIVYLTRRGKRIAAMVPADVAERFEQIEDDYWGRQAQEVLDTTRPEEWIPMEQVFAALDLHDHGKSGA